MEINHIMGTFITLDPIPYSHYRKYLQKGLVQNSVSAESTPNPPSLSSAFTRHPYCTCGSNCVMWSDELVPALRGLSTEPKLTSLL